VQLERIVGLCQLECLESLGLEVRGARRPGVSPVQAEKEEVVVILGQARQLRLAFSVMSRQRYAHPDGGKRGHRVQRGLDKVLDGTVLEEAVHLVLWHAEGMPVESRVTEETLEHDLVEEDGTELLLPDTLLLSDGCSLAQTLHVPGDSREEEGDLGEAEGPTRVATEIEVAAELVGVGLPVGVGMTEGSELDNHNHNQISLVTHEERKGDIFMVKRRSKSS
jgi:hypothetical protein